MDLVPAIQRTVADLDPTQPVYSISSLDDLLSGSIARERLVVVLSMLFAASALLLMGAGLYGVASAHVARLTRELGVRSALGADSWSLVGRTVRGVGATVVVGIGLGAVGTRVSNGLIETWFYEAPELRLSSLLIAGGAILFTSLAAAYGPARKVTQLDPIRALAAE
jgi:putative ABC transport system permease protein